MQSYTEQLRTDTRKNGSHCELPAVFSGLRATWFFAASPIKPWREAQESNTGFRATRSLRHHGFGGYGTSDHQKYSRDALGVREGHVGRGGPVALIVCDDLDAVVFPHADTAVRGAKILTAAGHTAICIHESRVRVLGQLSTTCENGKPGPRQQCQSEMILCRGTTITTNGQGGWAHSHGKPSVDTDCGLLGHGA